jgi:LysR family transcriptional regulator, regulator for bpeEF and oprC
MDELMAFVSVIDAGGFTAAARRTQSRKSTLSMRVRDLEARLGVPLLVRTTRSLRLTEEGAAYLEHARRSVASARDAEDVVVAARSAPRGTLRVTMAPTLAATVFDRVTDYLVRYPEVRLHLEATDRAVDLVREGFDLAVRVGPLDDSSLVSRRLGAGDGGFFASPAYLRRRGTPRHPDELLEHDVIVVPKGGRTGEWPMVVHGEQRQVRVKARLVVTDVGLAVRAAARGLGITRAPMCVVEPLLRRKQLVRVLVEHTLVPPEIHALYPPAGSVLPKTRLFLEMLADALG